MGGQAYLLRRRVSVDRRRRAAAVPGCGLCMCPHLTFDAVVTKNNCERPVGRSTLLSRSPHSCSDCLRLMGMPTPCLAVQP